MALVLHGGEPGAARHGIHSLAQLKPGTYEVSRYTADQVKREPFWNYLSRAGKRVAILDVPHPDSGVGLT
jgi:predicted AlkP superfamily phosphohydrolase/phosphomutase